MYSPISQPSSLLAEPRKISDWKRECVAIIPCFNEGTDIGNVVRSVLRQLPNVIVVDDGSTDSTREQALTAGAEVISHSSNMGKGRALQTGWQYASKAGFKWALTLDGDGQHAGEDVVSFLNCADKTNAPLIVGNRMHEANAIPWFRRQVNVWMSRRLSNLTGMPLTDSQCGYRLVRLDILAQLPPTTHHFEIESELLVNFVKGGQQVEFVPIQVIYKKRISKINPLVDTWRWFRWRFTQRTSGVDNRIHEPK